MKKYRVSQNGEERGPYTFEQLRSMWSSGQLTADTLYREQGMAEWTSIEGLGLDLAIQPVFPKHSTIEGTGSPHSSKVTTKSHGCGIVAIGSIMCFVGVIMMFTSAAAFGLLMLLAGFFVAVVGRLVS